MKTNLDEFFNDLAGTSGWCLQDGKIRTGTRNGSGNGVKGDCPITAVCRKLTGKPFSLRDYSEAAAEIGMGPWTAARITLASDNYPLPSDGVYEDLSKEVSLIRKRLLDVLGLVDQPLRDPQPDEEAVPSSSTANREADVHGLISSPSDNSARQP